ncbi:MAG: hypothetical protein IPM24_07150 [Bryobacterales bacterium]|nr:hypothetical protein [Bryobacterales bacterium]
MTKALATVFSAVLLTAGATAFAQTKNVTREGKNGGVREVTRTRSEGTVTTEKTVTGPGGKTATSERVRDTDGSDGQRGQTVTQAGPNGRTRSASQTWTKNEDGTATRERSATGSEGRTRSSTTTIGNGQATKTVTGRGGQTRTRTRTRQ